MTRRVGGSGMLWPPPRPRFFAAANRAAPPPRRPGEPRQGSSQPRPVQLPNRRHRTDRQQAHDRERGPRKAAALVGLRGRTTQRNVGGRRMGGDAVGMDRRRYVLLLAEVLERDRYLVGDLLIDRV